MKTLGTYYNFTTDIGIVMYYYNVIIVSYVRRLDQNDGVFDIGTDDSCSINDKKSYCNGPLRPVTNYRLKLRAFTADGFQDSWTVPFTTRK